MFCFIKAGYLQMKYCPTVFLQIPVLRNQIFSSNCNENNSSPKALHVFQHGKSRNIRSTIRNCKLKIFQSYFCQ